MFIDLSVKVATYDTAALSAAISLTVVGALQKSVIQAECCTVSKK